MKRPLIYIFFLFSALSATGQIFQKPIQDEELAKSLDYLDSVMYSNPREASEQITFIDTTYKLTNSQKAKINNRKGIISYLKGDYTIAIQHFRDELAFAEADSDTTAIIGAHQNIAGVYLEVGMYPEALKQHLKCLSLIQHCSASEKIALFNNTGNTYTSLKHYTKADSLFKLSLKEAYQIKDTFNLGIACGNLGYSHYMNAKENNQKSLQAPAETYLLKGINYAQNVNDLFGVLFCSVQLGKLYVLQGRYTEAKPLFIRANELALEMQTRSETEGIAYGLYETNRHSGNEALALQWLEAYTDLTRSERADSIKTEILKVRANYYNHELIEDYNLQIDSLQGIITTTESNRIANQNSAWLLIILIVIMFFVIAGLIFKASQRKNILDSVNEQIKQKSITLENANVQLNKNMQIALKLQQSAMPKEVNWERYFKDGFVYSYASDGIPRHSLWIQRDNQKTLICLMKFEHPGLIGAVLCSLTHQKLQRVFSKINTPAPSQILSDLNNSLSDQLDELGITYEGEFSFSIFSYKHNSRTLSYINQNQSLYQVNLTQSESEIKGVHGFTPLTAANEEQQIILNRNTWLYFWTIPQENTDNFTSLIRQNLSALSPKSSLFQKRFIELELKDKGIPDDFCLVGFKS